MINNRIAIIQQNLFAATWLTEREERTRTVVLEANPRYRDPNRGPRLERVIFRNDLTREQAIQLCMNTEGQVDLVSELTPLEAKQVEASPHARLVAVDGNRVLAGIFNRWQKEIRFDDRRLREAFNLAVNRQRLIAEDFQGYASSVAALTPPGFFDAPKELQPKPYDPKRAAELLREVGWPSGRVLRVATIRSLEQAVTRITRDFETALNIKASVTIISPEQQTASMRVLAEKKLAPDWDLLIVPSPLALFAEGTPAFIHREMFGWDGALRAGPKIERVDQLLATMATQTNREAMLKAAEEIDRYVYEEALGLFLCAPQTLYAVNRHVRFRPYRTTFELAETEVDSGHWSQKS